MELNAVQKEAIKQLYVEMYDALIAYAYAILQNYEFAEKAVQETFEIACGKPEIILNSQNPKGWLMNTLKNVLHNTKRSRAKMDKLRISLLQSNQWESEACYDDVDVDVLYSDLLENTNYQLLKKLSMEQKTIVEISDELGISVEACTKRVQRARKALKKKISENEK